MGGESDRRVELPTGLTRQHQQVSGFGFELFSILPACTDIASSKRHLQVSDQDSFLGVECHIHTWRQTPRFAFRLEGEVCDRRVSQQTPEQEVLTLGKGRNAAARSDERAGRVVQV